MIENLIRIRCNDTGNTYWFPPQDGAAQAPQLWELKVELRWIDQYGSPMNPASAVRSLVVERQTLVDAKCLSPIKSDKPPTTDTSVQDLLLELLERLNVRFE